MEVKTKPTSCCEEDCQVASGCSPARVPPCVRMASAYASKQDLCDRLEALADSLPFQPDRLECVRIATVLLPLLRDVHRYEEELLFPAFERGSTSAPAGGMTVRRLTSDHLQDECAAEEITEKLLWIGRGGETDNPEALGSMLRTFLETMRRHIAFEREQIIPSATPDPDRACEPRSTGLTEDS